jgi:hypothetical protein
VAHTVFLGIAALFFAAGAPGAVHPAQASTSIAWTIWGIGAAIVATLFVGRWIVDGFRATPKNG